MGEAVKPLAGPRSPPRALQDGKVVPGVLVSGSSPGMRFDSSAARPTDTTSAPQTPPRVQDVSGESSAGGSLSSLCGLASGLKSGPGSDNRTKAHGLILVLTCTLGVSMLLACSTPGFGETPVVGEYVNPLDADDCLKLHADDSCYMEILGLNVGSTGSWKEENGRIRLHFPDGSTLRGEIRSDAVVLEGFGALPVVWTKTTKSPPTVRSVAGTYMKEGHPEETLVLDETGSYAKTEAGIGGGFRTDSGGWELHGHAITFTRSGEWGSSMAAAVLDDRLYFTGLIGTEVWIGEPDEGLDAVICMLAVGGTTESRAVLEVLEQMPSLQRTAICDRNEMILQAVVECSSKTWQQDIERLEAALRSLPGVEDIARSVYQTGGFEEARETICGSPADSLCVVLHLVPESKLGQTDLAVGQLSASISMGIEDRLGALANAQRGADLRFSVTDLQGEIRVAVSGNVDVHVLRGVIGGTGILEIREVVRQGSSPSDDLFPESLNEELLRNRIGIPFVVSRVDSLIEQAQLSDATALVVTANGLCGVMLQFTRVGATQLRDALLGLGIGRHFAVVVDNSVFASSQIDESLLEEVQGGSLAAVPDEPLPLEWAVVLATNVKNPLAASVYVVQEQVVPCGALAKLESTDADTESIAIQPREEGRISPASGDRAGSDSSVSSHRSGGDGLSGEYMNPLQPSDALELRAGGGCYIKILGLGLGSTGTWAIEDSEVSLQFPGGTTLLGTVMDEAILLEGSGMLPVVWLRPEKTPPRDTDVAGSYAKEGSPDEELVLNPDHGFTISEMGFTGQLLSSSGEWDLESHVITLWRSGDGSLGLSAAVLDDRLYFTGLFGTDVWVKSDSPSGDRLDEEEREQSPSVAPPPIEWEQVLDSGNRDEAVMVQQTADGGYIVLANSMREAEGYPIEVIWLIKTDQAGNREWDRTFGGEGDRCEARGGCVRQTADGGYVIVTTAEINQADDAWLIKVDGQGEMEWNQMLGSPPAGYEAGGGDCVLETGDGGYVVVGDTVLYGKLGQAWLIRTDSRGDVLWDMNFGGPQRDWALSVDRAIDGGYIISGIRVFGSNWEDKHDDMWLIKVDSSGREEWERFYGGDAIDACRVLAKDEGGFILAGNTDDYSDHVADPWLWLADLDTSGAVVWERSFDEIAQGSPVWVAKAPYGGYVVCTGQEDYSFDSPSVLWILKVSAHGDLDWTLAMDRSSVGACVEPTADGGYIALGTTCDDSADNAVWLLKLGPELATESTPPIADAGKDRSLVDSDGDGEEEIILDGRESQDPDGHIKTFTWMKGGTEIGSGETPVVTLPVGTHRITLTVTDDDSLSSHDEVVMTIVEPAVTCAVELCQPGSSDKAEMVRISDCFDIHVVQSSGTVEEVRFSSDGRCDGAANGEWTDWYDWTLSSGEWDSVHKVMRWSFDSAGEKEVWAEIARADVKRRCAACTTAVFWVEVANVPLGRWSIRQSPGVSDEDVVLKRVPNAWALRVRDTHADEVDEDGYIWWEIEDTTEGLRGWMAARETEGDKRFLIGDPVDTTHQEELADRADPALADTRQERADIAKEAVEHYLGNTSSEGSLYSSNDTDRNGDPNDLSQLARGGFPIAVILAVVAQETGGSAYSNQGDGVMQVDYERSKGLASSIQCFSAESRYYGNTRQAIYANVKDGLRVLGDFFAGTSDEANAAVIATWKYNGGTYPKQTYCKCQGDPFYLAHIGIRLSGDDLLGEIHTCREQTFACLECNGTTCVKNERDCGYSPTPTIEDFGLAVDSSLAIPFKQYQTNNVTGSTCSPSELRIRDSRGRVTGVLDGALVEQIPHSAYVQGVPIVFVPDDTYRFEVTGLQDGRYSLVLSSAADGEQVSFVAIDMPTHTGAVHTYDIDWEAVGEGEDGVTLLVDQNGDGQPDETFLAGSELDGADLPLPTVQQAEEQGSQLWLFMVLGIVAGIVVSTTAVVFVLRIRKQAR